MRPARIFGSVMYCAHIWMAVAGGVSTAGLGPMMPSEHIGAQVRNRTLHCARKHNTHNHKHCAHMPSRARADARACARILPPRLHSVRKGWPSLFGDARFKATYVCWRFSLLVDCATPAAVPATASGWGNGWV